jgi:hypothetical protein
MATLAPADLNSKNITSAQGSAVIYDGKVSGTPGATDELRFVRVPAGTRVTDAFLRIATAFGASWAWVARLASCDGISRAIVEDTGTTRTLQGTATAVTAGLYTLNFEPVTTAADCFLELKLSAAGTPAAGVATMTVHGMAEGAR